MHSDYEGMDIDILQKLYEEQTKELEQAVLSGNAWELVSLNRKRLTELSKIFHEKLEIQGNPRPPEPSFIKRDGRNGPQF